MRAAIHLAPHITVWVVLFAGCAFSPTPPPAQPERSVQAAPTPGLLEGRWTGSITSRTIPDVDQDGEWQTVIALENCSGQASIRFRLDSGEYGAPIAVSQFALARTFLLVSATTESQDGSGWSETQVWTLVDARPKGWTIAQSRSVINQQMKPEDPWFTFRRLAWGSLEYDPDWCARR